MKIDLEQLDTNREIRPDVCIIGSGPAGMSMARRLIGARCSVALLEGGGENYEAQSAALYEGTGTGNAFPDPVSGSSYVQHMRQRYLGGSSNCWAGWCVPLDPIDFEEREWVPDSGWPLHIDDLQPWWREAEPVVDIQGYDSYDINDLRHEYSERIGFRCRWFETHVLHCSRNRVHFANKYGDEVTAAPNIDLFLHANVTDIRCNPEGTSVREVHARTLGGRTLTVKPKLTVIACGGIENARLMLSSDRDRAPGGLGNQHDLVGRYFMEHLTMQHLARVVISERFTPSAIFARQHHDAFNQLIYGCLCPTREAMIEHELLNCSVYFERKLDRVKVPMNPLEQAVFSSAPLVDNPRLLSESASTRNELYYGEITTRSEMGPHRENRVTLGTETDALGIPRTNLHWQVREPEYASVRRIMDLLSRDMGQASLGRIRLVMQETHPVVGGPHHMGTTRMSASPRMGVVNSDTQVHGIDNLYVAGSSVFPTGGFANPTYTIVALALRLAEHLRKELKA